MAENAVILLGARGSMKVLLLVAMFAACNSDAGVAPASTKRIGASPSAPKHPPCSRADPFDSQVADLIELTTTDDPQLVQLGVDGLFRLAPEMAPSVICRLDDRRAIGTRRIYALNSPTTFELYAPNGPTEVVDLLDLVLARLTRKSPCPIGSMATDEMRDACVKTWRKRFESPPP
jgi:hypothetical protein